MTATRLPAGQSVPRLALTKAEAAEALGVSVDFFEDHIMCELRIVRRGRRRLIPVAELVRWLEDTADRALPEPRDYSPRDRDRKASSSPAASRSLPGIKWP
jgi:excisionase family DNA binding protein